MAVLLLCDMASATACGHLSCSEIYWAPSGELCNQEKGRCAAVGA